MSKFNAREYVKNKYSNNGKEKTNTSPKSVKNKGFDARQYIAQKSLGLDTLGTDLKTTAETIKKIYNGWQTPETMKNTLSSIEGIYDRLNKYNEYQKQYGGTDLTEVANAYKQVIDDWGTLAEDYGQYQNADSYSRENEVLGKLAKMTSKDIEPYLTQKQEGKPTFEGPEYEPEDVVSDNFGSIGKTIDHYDEDGNPVYVKDAQKHRSSAGRLMTYNVDSPIAYTTVGGQNITWQQLYDKKKKQEEHVALWKEVSTDADFEKYKNLGETSDETNPVKWSVENKDGHYSEYADMAYTVLNKEELGIYNYYLGQEYSGVAEKGTAQKYLDSIYKTLKGRYEGEVIESMATYADKNPFLGSVASVGMNLLAPIEWLGDSVTYAFTGELDDNALARTSTSMRGAVADKYDWKVGGWDLFDFTYNTGMSMADSVVAMSTLGGAGGIVLGGSAAAQATNDALDRGMTQGQAFATGLASGVFECFFETFSIKSFKALKEAPVDGVKSIIRNIGKSIVVNAEEETLTEIANVGYDYLVNADLSQMETSYRAYINGGMSEDEARSKVIGQAAQRVVESGLSGALMGIGFGAGGGAISGIKNNVTGKSIRGNDSTDAMIDLAKNSPYYSDVYKAYTEYANKGINADNITNMQLGALHNRATTEAMKTIKSKKSTPTEIESAQNALRDLTSFTQKPLGQRIDTGAYTPDEQKDLIDNVIKKSDEGSEAHKVATEYKEKLDSGKKLTKKEISRLVEVGEAIVRPESKAELEKALTDFGERGDVAKIADAIYKQQTGEILTTAELDTIKNSDYGKYLMTGISPSEAITTKESMDFSDKVMTEAESRLFNELYDGKVDIEDFRKSFNLMTEYAKHNYSQDTMLEHKGVLTEAQVSAIYKSTIMAKIEAQKEKIAKAHEKMGAKMSYKGFIDESVINYTDKKIEGKVRWKDLNTRQRKAITFVKGIAKATGMNLVLTNKGLKEGYNGFYVDSNNTIVLDIDAGIDRANGKLEDTIIPTVSHELTHWMKNKAPELYRKMDELIFKTLGNEEQRVATEFAKLKKRLGNDVTETQARDEIIARACEDMLKMSEEGKKLFNSLSEVEQKTLMGKIKKLVADLKAWITSLLNSYDSKSAEAQKLREYEDALNEISKMWDAMFAEAIKNNQALELSGEYGHGYGKAAVEDITSIGATELSDLAKAENIDGKKIFQFRAMETDKDVYREMLLKHKDTIGITDKQITDLFNMIDKAVDIISDNLEALDYAWETDINDRAFMPVKPNSDSLYKVSLDFSTLCRKRLLQQSIQALLQKTLDKQLSREESIAIRDELLKIQEEGRQIEVACALCYVESARMKSPKQITKFLNNRESVIREFFANRSGGSIKEKIAKAEMTARENLKKANPDGLVGKNGVVLDALTAPKNRMLKADADYIRAEGKKAKASYKLTAHEQAELNFALKMNVDDFTSAKGLENLAKHHRDLFDAYTSFVRNATHSKGIENDTWWRAGDSDLIGDNLIAQMNAENGLRSQSWSDFQVIHLLDYIAATIELSTKGAKRQSYTKVPDYVKLLGNTGDMINISLIPERVFNGKLSYDGVEGMAYDIAKQLRDEYHKTVGTICIGINDAQIRMLLADATIDMVIPYHHSGMSKETRKLMHIPSWITYEKSQSEKKLSDADAKAQAKEYGVELDKESGNYGKSPIFSEWFNLEEARQIAKMENANPSDAKAQAQYGVMYGGYKAMQYAADNYLKLCAERGLAPKFSNQGVDFTKEANYWKLLIDRKMVDNVTGEVIEQKAIKPIFNEAHILEILNDELARYPQVKADQEYATRKVTEKFLSGEMKVDDSTLKAIQKPVDNVTNVNILEGKKQFALRDSDYMDAVNKGDVATQEKMVAEAAKEAGFPVRVYHGTGKFGFTKLNVKHSDDRRSFFATDSIDTAVSYTNGQSRKTRRISNKIKPLSKEGISILRKEITSAVNELAEYCNDTLGVEGWFDDSFIDDALNKAIKAVKRGTTPEDAATHYLGNPIADIGSDFMSAYFIANNGGDKDFSKSAEMWAVRRKKNAYAAKVLETFEDIVGRKSGIYDLYANTDGHLVIECNDSGWSNIISDGLPDIKSKELKKFDYEGDGRWTTRNVAAYAENLGYSGVTFKNLRDGGPSATVYIFFNPQSQLKSADPVTYDAFGRVIPLSKRFNEKKNDIRWSLRVTEQEDAEYMDAYYDGEDEKAQQIVDKVAERLGYKYKAYHHTENAFTVFDIGKARTSMDIQGIFFSADKDAEREYGSVRYDVYLKMENPYIVDSNEKRLAIPFDMSKPNAGVIAREWLQAHDYDGVIRKAEYFGAEADEYIVFDSNQIKSAEPYTYQDDANGEGDIIPLSERFNEKKNDIRYDLRDDAADFDAEFNAYTLEELNELSDEKIYKLYEALGLDNLLVDALNNSDVGEAIDDISEELNTAPQKIEILFRRNGLGKSHIEEKHMAVMTNERIVRSIADSGAGFHPTYARRYITRISPKDFIDLTVSRKNIDREAFDSFVEGDSGSTMGDYDYKSALRESKASPYLSIDRSTGQIIGHNGRHRIRALEMAGIESVEIEVEFHDEDGALIKYDAETIPDMAISSQFDTAIETRISNIIPLNNMHKDEIAKNYGEKAHEGAGVQYSLRNEVDSKSPTTLMTERTDEVNELLSKKGKRFNALADKRDSLGKFTEEEFNKYYFAHKFLRGETESDVANKVDSIKRDGFKSSKGGLSPVNIMSANNDNSNVMLRGYRPFKGETVLLIPNHWTHQKDSYVLDGYKPLPYEVVKIEYNSQPYYEAYAKAYNEYFGIEGEDYIVNKYRDYEYDELVKMRRDLIQEMVDDGTIMDSKNKKWDKANEIGGHIQRYFDADGNRYSLRDTESAHDILGETERLRKENEMLRKDFETLQERLKLERQVTHGNYFNEKQLGVVAGYLRNQVKSNYAKDELVEQLKDAYSYIAQKGEYADLDAITFDEFYEKAYGIAVNILNEAKPEAEVNDYAKHLLGEIRRTRISLSATQKAEAEYRFGKNYHRMFFGNAVIANDGISLDSKWKEWSRQYPDFFDAEATEGDQITALYDAIGKLKDASEVLVEYNTAEQARWLATEIYNKYWTVSPIETTADKYDKKIRLLNLEHRNRITELRDAYNERLKEQHKSDRAKFLEQAKKIREHRDMKIAEAKELGRERLSQYRENAERKTHIQRITQNALTLNEWLVKNSKEKHIHESLKGPVVALLNALDFSSKRLLDKGVPTKKDISLSEALSDVREMMLDANRGEGENVDTLGTALAGYDFTEDMKLLVNSVRQISKEVGDNEYVLNNMALEELETLDKIVRVIKHSVSKMNKLHAAKFYAGVVELSEQSEKELNARAKVVKDHKKHFDQLKMKSLWNNTTPYYAFKRFGPAAQAIFRAMQDGQDKLAFLAKEAIDFTEKTYSKKELKEWSKKYYEFEIAQPDGTTAKFSLNLPQIMSLYCLVKQEDARRHILHGNEEGNGGGITIVETKETDAVRTNILLTEVDLNSILAKLDENKRAKEVSDKLQEYMGTRGAELGNEITMARWGINSFGIKDYFPIKVSSDTIGNKDDTIGVEGNSLVKLLNMSFTKARNKFASNSVEIGDIFDVFSSHMSDMMRYNSFALPILDMYKWMNYRGKDGFGKEHSVSKSIKDAFGDDAWNYVRKFMEDTNGSSKSQRRDNLAIKFFKNAKVAKVALSISTVLLQPTSYIRAGAVMDNKYLIRALGHKPKVNHAKKYCGIALWKSLGYYDTDITRGLTDKIKHDSSVKDKITEGSLYGVAKADEVTWGYLWNACELEVRDKQPKLKPGTKEFFDAVGLRLRDIVYATQVVDSTMTRSNLMRGTDGMDKFITTFASEPTISLNMVNDAFISAKLAKRMGEKVDKKHIRKTITAYTVTNIVAAAVQTLMSAFRDIDDDKEEDYYWWLMLQNIGLNTSYLNKLPWINQIFSVLQGFDSKRMDTEWMDKAVKSASEVLKLMDGKGSVEKMIRYGLGSLSDATGIAGYNLYRDVMATIDLFTDVSGKED